VNESKVTALADCYIDLWNERDPGQRRHLIERIFSETGTYRDPLLAGDGRSGIEAMIAEAQTQFGHYRFRRTGPVDVHHDRIRFTWELSDNGDDVQVAGIDFGAINGDGLFDSIAGFFDIYPGGE